MRYHTYVRLRKPCIPRHENDVLDLAGNVKLGMVSCGAVVDLCSLILDSRIALNKESCLLAIVPTFNSQKVKDDVRIAYMEACALSRHATAPLP